MYDVLFVGVGMMMVVAAAADITEGDSTSSYLFRWEEFIPAYSFSSSKCIPFGISVIFHLFC